MLITWKLYLLNANLHELVLFWRTVRLWVESPCQGPFGGRSIGRRANPGKVSLLHVPQLITEVARALHYARAPLHGPPARPRPFAVDGTVAVAEEDKRTVITA